MGLNQKEKKLSRRLRKKMAKVQRCKAKKSIRGNQKNRAAIYKHLIGSPSSTKILEHLDTGFERELFLAALNNLSDKGNPLRFNNFAYCMREIITLVLAKYSSDEEILNCCWYKNDTDKENGVTRAQRVKYAIQGGLSDQKVVDILDLDEDEHHIKDALKEFTRQFNELNGYTHLRESRFNIGDSSCEELALKVLDIMSEILGLVEDMRSQVVSHIEAEVDEALVSEFVGTVFGELDILSTHTTVDYHELESIHVEAINSDWLVLRGLGTVHCDLQWGSGSDMRKGIGASITDSFPYHFKSRAKLSDLKKMELFEEGIIVDTDSWYE